MLPFLLAHEIDRDSCTWGTGMSGGARDTAYGWGFGVGVFCGALLMGATAGLCGVLALARGGRSETRIDALSALVEVRNTIRTLCNC